MIEKASEITQQSSSVWYAVRTFNCQELKVGDYFTSQGKDFFIPMSYVERLQRDGKVKRLLAPVVHNLIFLKKDFSQSELRNILTECPVPVNIFRHVSNNEFCEISEREMTEFRILCDPHYQGTQFITPEEAELRPGHEVRVVHGPFSGITGKLHRMNKEYFIIKSVVGISVMVRIPRIYCKPV